MGAAYLASRYPWCVFSLGTGRIPADTEFYFSFFSMLLLLATFV